MREGNVSETSKRIDLSQGKAGKESVICLDMTDLRRTIILLMALACVITVIGVIHCHVNHPYVTDWWYPYRMSYSVIFPIRKSSVTLISRSFPTESVCLFSAEFNGFSADRTITDH